MATTATSGFVLLDAFRPEINQYIQEAPAILIRKHVISSIITFCERTMCLKRDPSTFYLDEDEHTYTLKYASDRYRVVAIDDCRLGTGSGSKVINRTTENELDHEISNWREHTGNYPTRFFLTDDVNTVRFYKTPDQDSTDEITIRSIVVPKRDQTEVDSFLQEKWEDIIQAGALASLFLIPGSSWYSAELANGFAKAFKRGVLKARKTTVSGTGQFPGRTIPQSYIVPGPISRRTTSWD